MASEGGEEAVVGGRGVGVERASWSGEGGGESGGGEAAEEGRAEASWWSGEDGRLH